MTYEQKLRMADLMHIADSSNKDYWAGYRRGLQRAFFGATFSTDQDHHNWMTMTGDVQREACCHGYRDGYGGKAPTPGENYR